MEHCSCPECISACRNDAGRLVPAELEPLATFLNVTVKELVCGYLVKKPYTWKTATVYVPAPAKLKGNSFLAEPGSIIPDYYEKQSGCCIFLDENGHCSVHAVKPFECGAYMGCKNTFLGKPYKTRYVEDYFILKWKNFNWQKFDS